MSENQLYLFDDVNISLDKNRKPKKRDDYEVFIDKFKPKKTTDDCYTPENIYDAVAEWVANEYGVSRENFVRPFWPNGDYERFDYPADCIVVDNPPFSILARIVRFYSENKIKFLLFANGLTLFSNVLPGVCVVAVGVNLTYENGADINTSFITNLDTSQARSAPTLYQALKIENDKNIKQMHKQLPKYQYPANVLTPSRLAQFSQKGIDFKVEKGEAFTIKTLDSMKELKPSGIFGYALLISDAKAAEKLAAEKLAAEKLAEKEVIEWSLSARELDIISRLSSKNNTE